MEGSTSSSSGTKVMRIFTIIETASATIITQLHRKVLKRGYFLKQYENNTPIKIKIDVKKIQNFYVDLDDMSNKLSNSEIRKFERICWGAFDEEELFNK